MRNLFLLLGIVLLISFALFSKFVKRGNMDRIDFDVTVRLQDNIPSRFDQVMDDGAVLADPFVSSGLVIVLAFWLFVKTKRIKRMFVLVVPLAFFVLTTIEIYGKTTLPHPGPPFFMVKQPTTIFPKYHVLDAYAYPSGHAARSTFLGVVFGVSILYFGKKNRIKKLVFLAIIASYVLFVAVSRIYLGHHWTSDIVGGLMLGSSFSLLTLVWL